MNWDEYAMSIAEVVAKKSKDPWRQVGAVILREDNSIASVGYNGFPQGIEEDWSDRDEKVYFFEPLEKEISVEDMQKIVDANEKLVKELKDVKD